MSRTVIAASLVVVCLVLFATAVKAHSYGDICDQIRGWNIPCEHLNATTADGFILDVLHLKNTGNPIIMQHGLLMTADTFVANTDPTLNFATIMYAKGYDIYLPNSRGNHYSRRTLKPTVDNISYWRRVDVDEMAAFDVPAVIDLALQTTTTGAKQVTWVGHSEGTFMIFAALGTSARAYAAKINLFIALAPVAYVGHCGSPMLKRIANDTAKIQQIAYDLGIYSVMEDDWGTHLVGDLCPLGGPKLCPELLSWVFGPSNYSNFADNLYPTVTQFTPGGTSVNNLVHWGQMMAKDVFAMHDFSPERNMEYYHSLTPPSYNLSAFPPTTPVVLASGLTDALADAKDVARMVAELPATAIVDHIVFPDYGHMDFVWGLDAKTRLYPKLAQWIDKYNK